VTSTVAICSDDPLQVCVDGAIAALVHDPWLVRRLVALIRDAGFQECRLRGFAYTQTDDADYMLTLVERGADALLAEGKLSAEEVEELKTEAQARRCWDLLRSYRLRQCHRPPAVTLARS
jgi:arsenite methyltransferase